MFRTWLVSSGMILPSKATSFYEKRSNSRRTQVVVTRLSSNKDLFWALVTTPE